MHRRSTITAPLFFTPISAVQRTTVELPSTPPENSGRLSTSRHPFLVGATFPLILVGTYCSTTVEKLLSGPIWGLLSVYSPFRRALFRLSLLRPRDPTYSMPSTTTETSR